MGFAVAAFEDDNGLGEVGDTVGSKSVTLVGPELGDSGGTDVQ